MQKVSEEHNIFRNNNMQNVDCHTVFHLYRFQMKISLLENIFIFYWKKESFPHNYTKTYFGNDSFSSDLAQFAVHIFQTTGWLVIIIV